MPCMAWMLATMAAAIEDLCPTGAPSEGQPWRAGRTSSSILPGSEAESSVIARPSLGTKNSSAKRSPQRIDSSPTHRKRVRIFHLYAAIRRGIRYEDALFESRSFPNCALLKLPPWIRNSASRKRTESHQLDPATRLPLPAPPRAPTASRRFR